MRVQGNRAEREKKIKRLVKTNQSEGEIGINLRVYAFVSRIRVLIESSEMPE